MICLSSNHFSHDDQVADVLSHLALQPASPEQVAMEMHFSTEFPEYNHLEWSGSWVDCEASGVDPEYMSWVTDWIEANTPVRWWEGEPVIFEDGDEPDE